MATPSKTAPKLLAREIAALTDPELDQYLEQKNRIISIQDPDQLPQSFIQRLQDRAAQPRTVSVIDLDQVNSRLLSLARDPPSVLRREGASPSSSRSRTASPEPIQNCEREAYGELVRRGGRPAFPIHLIDDVIRDPTKYRRLLAPFLTTPADWEDPIVFTIQLGSWSTFHSWQHAVRRKSPNRGSTRILLSQECLAALKEFDQVRADKSLAAYADAVKRTILDVYHLEYPFQPAVDSRKQDKVSTWLEYLTFKHYASKHYQTRLIEPQARYDRAWPRLVSLGVLEPLEVKLGEITDGAYQKSHRETELRLERKVQDNLALLSQATDDDKEAVGLRLADFKAELERVQARLRAIDIFLKETTIYRRYCSTWKIEADRHTKELSWILAQLPLVWRETWSLRRSPRLLRAASSGPLRLPGSTEVSRKRRRPTVDEPRQSSQESTLSDSLSLPRAGWKRRRKG